MYTMKSRIAHLKSARQYSIRVAMSYNQVAVPTAEINDLLRLLIEASKVSGAHAQHQNLFEHQSKALV